MTLALSTIERRAVESAEQGFFFFVRIQFNDLSFYDYASGTVRLNKQQASASFADVVQNVHEVTPVGYRLDPIMRRVQTSGVTVTFVDDGHLRFVMSDQGKHMKNATMDIQLAVDWWPSGNFIPYWKGLVKDVIPRDGFIDVIGEDALHFTDGVRYYGQWSNEHPYTVIVRLAEWAGVDAALIDTTTLDADADTGISHLVVGSLAAWGSPDTETVRQNYNPATGHTPGQTGDFIAFSGGNDGYVQTPDGRYINEDSVGVDVKRAIEDLGFMCNAAIYVDETGQLTAARFDPAKASDDTWTADDIIGDLRVRQTFEGMINEVNVEFGEGPSSQVYNHKDTAAQSFYAAPNESIRREALKVRMPFAGAFLWSLGDLADWRQGIDAVETSFVVNFPPGMCGARLSDTFKNVAPGFDISAGGSGPLTQPANALLSSSRRGYIKIGTELIEITAMGLGTVWDEAGYEIVDTDGYGEDDGTVSIQPWRMDVTASTRGFAGTASAHDNQNFAQTGARSFEEPYDVTAQRLVATSIVERCSNGLPIVEVTTSLAKIEYQIGDFITLVDDLFVWVTIDGLSASNTIKWEIVGKEIDPATWTIRWVLAFADIATPPVTPTLADQPVSNEFRPSGAGSVSTRVSIEMDETIQDNDETVIPFDTIDFGDGLGMDTATGQYTVVATGLYDIVATARIESIDLTEQSYVIFRLEIEVDGTAIAVDERTIWIEDVTTGTMNVDLLCQALSRPLVLGEVVRATIFHNDGAATYPLSGGSEFTTLSIHKIA